MQLGHKGEPFKSSESYAKALQEYCQHLNGVDLPYADLFYCTDAKEFATLEKRVRASKNFNEVNQKKGSKGTFSAALGAYQRFLDWRESGELFTDEAISASSESNTIERLSVSNEQSSYSEILVDASYENASTAKLRDYDPVAMNPEQIIFFGAPGTGKSFEIKEKIKTAHKNGEDIAEHCVRVTFHPDYDYSDFVGALRPVRDEEKNLLDYKFLPGPMTRILVDCFNHPKEPFFLIIEELNRGNAPAIFGDLFQLLDREPTGESIYRCNNQEVASHIKDKTLYRDIFDNDEIWFPSNLSILCSMNTADQNVFVLDTAFSRRFDREYVKIDFDRLKPLEPAKKNIYMGEIDVFSGDKALTDLFANTELAGDVGELKDIGQLKRNWSTFAILVNRLIDIVNKFEGTDQISEDKKLGPFFVSETDLLSKSSFVNKVIYYLKQDVFRYSEQYFNSPFQRMFDEYSKDTGDLFTLLLLKGGE
jgi:hypothetical protein